MRYGFVILMALIMSGCTKLEFNKELECGCLDGTIWTYRDSSGDYYVTFDKGLMKQTCPNCKKLEGEKPNHNIYDDYIPSPYLCEKKRDFAGKDYDSRTILVLKTETKGKEDVFGSITNGTKQIEVWIYVKDEKGENIQQFGYSNMYKRIK